MRSARVYEALRARAGAAEGWHFLTGSEAQIRRADYQLHPAAERIRRNRTRVERSKMTSVTIDRHPAGEGQNYLNTDYGIKSWWRMSRAANFPSD